MCGKAISEAPKYKFLCVRGDPEPLFPEPFVSTDPVMFDAGDKESEPGTLEVGDPSHMAPPGYSVHPAHTPLTAFNAGLPLAYAMPMQQGPPRVSPNVLFPQRLGVSVAPTGLEEFGGGESLAANSSRDADGGGGLSEYELERQRSIADNEKELAKIGLGAVAAVSKPRKPRASRAQKDREKPDRASRAGKKPKPADDEADESSAPPPPPPPPPSYTVRVPRGMPCHV
jgi:hypothetical protein